MGDLKKDILARFAVVYALILIGFICVVARIAYLQIAEGDFWEKKAKERYVQMQEVKAKRGNIYSVDGDSGELLLLATDIPLYNAYIDLGYEYRMNKDTRKKERVRVLEDSIYRKNISELCDSLAFMFKGSKNPKSKREYMNYFASFRGKESGNKYVLIQKDITFEQYERFRKFPLISKEKKKTIREKKTIKGEEKIIKRTIGTGKFFTANYISIVERTVRYYPYGNMARRTIGTMVRANGCDTCYNGIDGFYSSYLRGMHGKRLEKKINPGIWIPVDDNEQIKAIDGMDIVSTIDVRLQELAENSLRKCLDSNSAESGCVILMEVKTGYVRAISNLTINKDGQYLESENIAVSHLLEPGSTFKTITAMMMLDKGMADTSIMLPTFSKQFPGATKPIKDVGEINHGMVSLTRAMQMSSNVSISQLVYNNYIAKGKRTQIAKDLKEYFLFEKLGLDIDLDEPKPYINEKATSVDDILRLGFGYVSVMTPLQLLTFYNAIANDGKMLKPMFVSQVMKDGQPFKTFEPVVLRDKICKDKTLKEVRDILEKVVLFGTAKRLRNPDYGIAGKTGTAEIGYDNKQNILQHRASFVGYFPADNPQFSCIVVISKPQKSRTHGGDLAAPVFKDLSDRVVGTMITYKSNNSAIKTAPAYVNGNVKSFTKFCTNLKLNAPKLAPKTSFAPKNIVPNVIGMSVRDAVFLLEKSGLKVSFEGKGKVASQSLQGGSAFRKGNRIHLQLNTATINDLKPMLLDSTIAKSDTLATKIEKVKQEKPKDKKKK